MKSVIRKVIKHKGKVFIALNGSGSSVVVGVAESGSEVIGAAGMSSNYFFSSSSFLIAH